MRLRRTTNNENSGANGRPTAAYDQISWVALQGDFGLQTEKYVVSNNSFESAERICIGVD
jgi:hypothetical protein